ncbi:putative MFS family arabinose efflux permease [Diaminobutyricimonas aerilata]|uniref:Putative MFS family arabinose efflux permease n=1 Tax=Diaminobutyricimonas aerilata TaxID=1162967 RepID=A0A2M9CIA8_9MICO|nr:MFS transporter [Diaminobutyricimonas aerilata]PJJ71618.1 putative MFS family arabinose efflux permease [Diaminobutyricimonas aerilata]
MSLSPTDPAAVTAPLPVLNERPKWRDTFDALRSYNYRLYVTAQLVANTTGWMQRIATDWLVLELTGNVALVGLTIALQFLPMLLLGAVGGVVADRVSKRHMILAIQTVVALLSGLLAILAITGTVELWHVYVIVFVIGLLQVFDGPARSVFVNELVGHSRLRNAISLNASIFHLGGLLGPAVSGVLIVVVGAGWAIAINAAAAVITITSLLLMRTSELRIAPRVPGKPGQVREAVRYIRSKPTIYWPLTMLAFVSVFGMSLPSLLAGMADRVYYTGATGYGLYNSLVAVGALTGALLSTRRMNLRLRSIVIAAFCYGALQMTAGLVPLVAVFLPLLIGVGMARLLFATAAESMTQLSTNLAIRGRVMSFYILVLVGGQAIGGPLLGWLAEHYGPRLALVISGAVPAVAAIVIGLVLARSGQLTLRVELHRRGFVRIVPRKRRANRPADDRTPRRPFRRGRGTSRPVASPGALSRQ